jgi:ABC-type antimicrobial peptide transport system permease subunit
MAYAALGALAGWGAALATSRLLGSLLFGVSQADPASLLAAVALVLGVAAGACVRPALRAARTDPAVVLRRE